MPVPDLLDVQEALGGELTLPPFACLEPDAELYMLALLQPGGAVSARPDFVGAANRTDHIAKVSCFLKLASESSAKLVVTPEYSCPWEVLEGALRDGLLPDEDALWVLGCEGIPLTEAAQIQQRTVGATWVGIPAPQDEQGFVDPLCYVFRARNEEGDVVPVVLVQCKATSMPDKLYHFERDHMIRANSIYVFNQNREDKIRLLTIICSDSHAFAGTGICETALTAPYLVLHSQLCLDPFHEAFRNYRTQDFIRNREAREFLALNWASGFQVPGYDASLYGGSALYTKSSTVNDNDERINDLHVKGIYYGWNGGARRAHIYFLNYTEAAVLFRTTKAFQGALTGAIEGNGRTGPQDAVSYAWDSVKWDDVDPEDGIDRLCTSSGANQAVLLGMAPLDRERFLSLATGTVRGLRMELRSARTIASLQVDETERAHRIAVALHPEYRDEARTRLARFRTLEADILANPAYFPECIRAMRDDCQLAYPIDDDGECNLCSGSALPATVAYIGDAAGWQAEQVADRIDAAIADHRRSRIVVWFRQDGHYRCFTYTANRIDETTRLGKSIT